MNVAETGRGEQVIADADGTHDVDGEERYPAEQEHSCGQIIMRPSLQIMYELLHKRAIYFTTWLFTIYMG